MPQNAAIIEESTFRVDNVVVVTNNPPPLPFGYRYLTQDQWAAGQSVSIGKIWNGDMPATFADAPEAPPIAENLPDAIALSREALQVQMNRLDEIERLATGN